MLIMYIQTTQVPCGKQYHNQTSFMQVLSPLLLALVKMDDEIV